MQLIQDWYRAITGFMLEIADDVLLASYVPVVTVSVVVAFIYVWWTVLLFRWKTHERPELRYLILGIALMFSTHGLEQACLGYARNFGNLYAYQTNYILLSVIKFGYILSGALHIYGFSIAAGLNKWFWRFMFLVALMTVASFALTGRYRLF